MGREDLTSNERESTIKRLAPDILWQFRISKKASLQLAEYFGGRADGNQRYHFHIFSSKSISSKFPYFKDVDGKAFDLNCPRFPAQDHRLLLFLVHCYVYFILERKKRWRFFRLFKTTICNTKRRKRGEETREGNLGRGLCRNYCKPMGIYLSIHFWHWTSLCIVLSYCDLFVLHSFFFPLAWMNYRHWESMVVHEQ
jgi:hypothetical protein